MKEVILTGYSRKEVERAKGKMSPRCYLCRRKRGEGWVFVKVKGEEGGSGLADDYRLKFYICDECTYFLEAIGERSALRYLSLPH